MGRRPGSSAERKLDVSRARGSEPRPVTAGGVWAGRCRVRRLERFDGYRVAELCQPGDELVLAAFGVLAPGAGVVAEFLVGHLAVQDAVDDQDEGVGDGHGGFLLRPGVAVPAETADQAVVLGAGPGAAAFRPAGGLD